VPVRVEDERDPELSGVLEWQAEASPRTLRITLPNGVLMDFETRCEPASVARFAAALGGL
jgi:hypothetical protein